VTVPIHEISVASLGFHVPGWKNYSITQDILQPANQFQLEVRFTREAWDALPRDAEIEVFVGDVGILSGFIDDRAKVPDRSAGTQLQITGRDRTGRMVDESSPLFRYGGKDLKTIAEDLAGVRDNPQLFSAVRFENKNNRSLLRNVRARQSKFNREPLRALLPVPSFFSTAAPIVAVPIATLELLAGVAGAAIEAAPKQRPPLIDPGIFTGKDAPKRVEPGSSRWEVLELFLREARLLAWSSGDGDDLIIAPPNYAQDAQYFFYEAGYDSRNRDQTNCSITVNESNGERYSMITAVGSARGSDADYGSNITKHRATVFDNPNEKINGVGASFRRRKALLITDDSIRSQKTAIERAEREQQQRDANLLELVISVPGHSQIYSGEEPTLYAVDTIAHVVDEDTGIDDLFYVTSVTYTHSRDEGTRTELRLVPRGTFLSL
jgi:prophage tail gpP-like protein